MAQSSNPNTARLSGLVIGVGTVLIIGFLVLALSTFAGLPPLKSLLTPHAVLSAPEFAAVVETAVQSADPARGERLYSQYACSACHLPESIGTAPMIKGMGERAAGRRPNYSAAAYLYESIVDPNAFVVPDYPAGVMIQNFKETMPERDAYDLVAWMLKQ